MPPAEPGWNFADADWTCEGGATIGIDVYAEALGTDVVVSPFDKHEWYVDAPELGLWRTSARRSGLRRQVETMN